VSRERNLKFQWQDSFLARSGHTRAVTIAVAWWMSNRWNGDTQTVVAPLSRIVADVPFGERAVQTALKELRESGWVAQHRVGRNVGRDGGTASTYRLTFPSPVRTDVRPNTNERASQDEQPCALVDPSVDPLGRPLADRHFNSECFAADEHRPGEICPWCPPVFSH
jgi:hypothetical protein